MSDAAIFRGLFLAWQRVTAAYNAETPPDGSDRERTLYRRMRDLEAYAAQLPAQTLEAFAFKVLIADDMGYLDSTAGTRALVAEAQAIAVRMDRAEDSRVLRLFRQREALRAAYAVYPVPEGLGHYAECEALFFDLGDELETAMMAEPAVTAADFAAKAIVATAHGDIVLNWQADPLWQEARRLVE